MTTGREVLLDRGIRQESRDCIGLLQRFAFVRRGRSWVPSPLAGEGQGEGKSSVNESTHPNEKCCSVFSRAPLGRREEVYPHEPGVTPPAISLTPLRGVPPLPPAAVLRT